MKPIDVLFAVYRPGPKGEVSAQSTQAPSQFHTAPGLGLHLLTNDIYVGIRNTGDDVIIARETSGGFDFTGREVCNRNVVSVPATSCRNARIACSALLLDLPLDDHLSPLGIQLPEWQGGRFVLRPPVDWEAVLTLAGSLSPNSELHLLFRELEEDPPNYLRVSMEELRSVGAISFLPAPARTPQSAGDITDSRQPPADGKPAIEPSRTESPQRRAAQESGGQNEQGRAPRPISVPQAPREPNHESLLVAATILTWFSKLPQGHQAALRTQLGDFFSKTRQTWVERLLDVLRTPLT